MSVLDDLILPLPTTRDAAFYPWTGERGYLPRHLSASSLSMLEKCAELFRRRYVLGEKERPSVALVWGSADTKAHAVNFQQKIDSHEDIPEADVKDAFAAMFDSEIERVGGQGEIDWRETEPGEVKDRGVALVGAYHRQVSPRVQPETVEQPFELAIPGVPVPYIGYMDITTEPVVIERKTAKAKASAINPEWRVQTLGYALAAGRPVEVHVSAKTKLPAVYTPLEEPGLLLGYDEGLVGRAERVIARRAEHMLLLWNTYGPEQPWPDAIGTQAWHTPICDLCGFGPFGNQTCPWWA